MRFLPKTRWAWVRFSALASLLLVGACVAHVPALSQLISYKPQEGDIVFQSLPHVDLVDAIEGITDSPWSHCGVVMRRGSHWVVVESIGMVRETPLPLWIMRGRGGRFEAYRLRDRSSLDTTRLSASLASYLGRLYDYHYAQGDGEIYCSELVYLGYKACGLQLGEWQRLRDLRWQPYEGFIRSMEDGVLPLERSMITPVALTRSTLLVRVHPK